MRLVLDEVFNREFFRSEIIWKRKTGRGQTNKAPKEFGTQTDTVLFYSKNDNNIFSDITKPLREEYIHDFYKFIDENGRRYRIDNLSSPSPRPNLMYTYKGYSPPKNGWAISREKMEVWDKEGRLYFPKEKSGRIQRKRYLDENEGEIVQNLWDDISIAGPQSSERIDYPTQKPEALIERIIKASSNEGDLVADFFCGSGTTAAVAEKLERKWIVSDLGKFAIHTTRKRMIGVQRQLKEEGRGYRAFEILNLGKYERQHYIGINPNLRQAEQQKQLEEKEAAFIDLILRAYRAEKTENFACFHGKKAGRLVAVGPVNLPVTRLFIEEIILECRQKHITRVDILGFEFEMGLFPNVLDEARAKGIDIAPKYIPAEVFDKRAVEKNQVVFHDVAAIEVKTYVNDNRVAVELTDFSVFYSQDSIANAEAAIKDKGSRIVAEKGQIVKVSKDAHGIVSREVLTKNWTDWIDYWAVDFNFESKREIIRVKAEETGDWEERWTGDYIFENEWQSFRTKKDRSLDLKTPVHECTPGRRKIAVKVVDIFGNDTMTIVDVSIGQNGGKK
jgi:DNA modification methylase